MTREEKKKYLLGNIEELLQKKPFSEVATPRALLMITRNQTLRSQRSVG